MSQVPVRDLPSPNQDDRPPGERIEAIVLHYTGMQSAAAAIERLRDPAPPTGVRVSSHYVVEEDGAVWRLVPEIGRAFHAGLSCWRGRERLNDRSIGIEVVNPGHEWGYRDFPPAQIAAVRDLCLDLQARHAIPLRNVVAHSDVAPDRKQDPGERFPWQDLARAGVGLWPEGVADPGPGDPLHDADALRTLGAELERIGYRVPPEDGSLRSVLLAFQRHWRPEAVTGEADPGTRMRIAAVARLAG